MGLGEGVLIDEATISSLETCAKKVVRPRINLQNPGEWILLRTHSLRKDQSTDFLTPLEVRVWIAPNTIKRTDNVVIVTWLQSPIYTSALKETNQQEYR